MSKKKVGHNSKKDLLKNPVEHIDNVLDRVLKARDAIIAHLNYVCIWLGFHSFGLYIHNDTMSCWRKLHLNSFSYKASRIK